MKWIRPSRKPARRPAGKKPEGRARLGVEALERRELLTVNLADIVGSSPILLQTPPASVRFDANTRTLAITGSDSPFRGDVVVVETQQLGNVVVKIGDQVAGTFLRYSVKSIAQKTQTRKPLITKITFVGQQGNDYFENKTNIPSMAWGGDGNDILHGGQANDELAGGNGDLASGDGNDYLRGHGGNDKLWGEAGNDQVHGDAGNDYLWGGAGDDELSGDAGRDTMWGGDHNDYLRGGAGNDELYGGAGNDNLYGGTGSDALDGEAGNDGLFGGRDDRDTLTGGTGQDRFLIPRVSTSKKVEDRATDVFLEDARLYFQKGDKNWTNDEIERVDAGFAMLHARTNNVDLLKMPNRTDGIAFARVRSISGGYAADNNGLGTIRFADLGISSETPSVVLHEIGHNWAFGTYVFSWESAFLRLSGWTQIDPGSSQYTKVTNHGETWWYRTSAKFATEYAKTHPEEDFAESFMVTINGTAASIPEKAQIINTILNSVRS
jgi:hypothetical protein